MYYNSERKNTYFDELEARKPGSSIPILYIFKKVKSIEKMWDKDVCDFTIDEIKKILAMFNASSLNALAKTVSILRSYTEWCCSNRLSIDNINHYNEIKLDMLSLYVNKKKNHLVTREELMKILSQFYNVSDRFLFLALFEGVVNDSISELFQLTPDNIDPKNRSIIFNNGKEKFMSKQLYEYALSSSVEEEYCTIRADGVETVTKLQLGNIINSRNNVSKDTLSSIERRATSRFEAIRKGYDMPYLTIPKLKMAGVIHSIKEVMEKHNITKDEFFGDNYKLYVSEVNPNFEIHNAEKKAIKKRLYRFM